MSDTEQKYDVYDLNHRKRVATRVVWEEALMVKMNAVNAVRVPTGTLPEGWKLAGFGSQIVPV